MPFSSEQPFQTESRFGQSGSSSFETNNTEGLPHRDHMSREHLVLEEMKKQDQQRYDMLLYAEQQLARAIEENPKHSYERAKLVVKDEEVPFWRVLDLSESLSSLESFRDELPGRHKLNTEKVLQRADQVKNMLEDYMSWGERNKSRYTRFAINESLVGLLVQLRRISPALFPNEPPRGLTDEEFILLTLPVSRQTGSGLIREARMAELNPERFRRLFSQQYTPHALAEQRRYWNDVERNGRTSIRNCVKAWQQIEQALNGGENGTENSVI